jgi:2-octaprenyl-6-methoxyphenol hydroxylase
VERTDILVAGGGIAGLTAAAALAAAGWSVTVADPAPPGAGPADTRTTAFLAPARALFETAGVWNALAPSATRLDVLRLIDTAGWPPTERTRRDFAAADLGEETFGWNLPNATTREALARALGSMPGVTLRLGVGFRAALVRDREVIVTLTDGARLAARLVVGADGRASAVRDAAGSGATVTRYGQRALAFVVTHPEPHGNVSTEIYNRGGAFTLVPMADREGRHASAVVWMEDGPRAVSLAALDPVAFGAEATSRSASVLGPLEVALPVGVWPVVTQVADRLTAQRTVLIAEAAHVLPPIGAQGLNVSLADIAALAGSLRGDDPGAEAGLDAYARARQADIRARAAAIDLFNRVCRSGAPPVQALRRAGLSGLHDLAPLRRSLMRAGLGG